MEIDTHLKQPQNGLKRIKAMVKTIRTRSVAYVLETLAPNECTGGAVIDILLQWLQERYFPAHIVAPVWASIRAHGVIMPGHDTPAAGWLLPVIGETEMTSQGVMYQGVAYGNPLFRCEPGQHLLLRSYPYYYLQRDNGIFVQVGTGNMAYVQYLVRKM
jgi:hypothetical protein